MVSASVVGMPWGKTLLGFNDDVAVSSLRQQAPRSAPSRDDSGRSGSPCITRDGTVLFFRSSVKSVWEKQRMPSLCACDAHHALAHKFPNHARGFAPGVKPRRCGRHIE